MFLWGKMVFVLGILFKLGFLLILIVGIFIGVVLGRGVVSVGKVVE